MRRAEVEETVGAAAGARQSPLAFDDAWLAPPPRRQFATRPTRSVLAP